MVTVYSDTLNCFKARIDSHGLGNVVVVYSDTLNCFKAKIDSH